MFLYHISFCKCQARVYFPWQKIEPFEGDICLTLKNWFCSCAVWMSGLWGWMKKAKQNGGRKAFSSRGRFLSRNKEPRSSQSLWFIITLGIPHSCPTFRIRIFKTELFCLSFPLDPVLHHGHQRLDEEICNCTIRTEVNCQQTYRTFISCWTWNRAQLNKFTTNLEFIDSKITCLFGPKMMDILFGCISHHHRFPTFLGRFARPLHNATQT